MYEDVIVNSDRWFDDNDFKNENGLTTVIKGKIIILLVIMVDLKVLIELEFCLMVVRLELMVK